MIQIKFKDGTVRQFETLRGADLEGAHLEGARPPGRTPPGR